MNRNATALPRDVAGYWRAVAGQPYDSTFKVASNNETPTRGLNMIERATARAVVPPIEDVPVFAGLASEATFRLATFQERGLLQYASGWWIARTLQETYFNSHPRALVNSHRGWDLLYRLDLADYIVVTLSADEPPPSIRFRRIRLRDRVAEMS